MKRHIVLLNTACLIAAAFVLTAPVALAQKAEDLRVTIGKSLVIDYPEDVTRISTSNPEIIDAVAVTTREILLHAKGHGTATLVVWSRSGQRGFYNVNVEHNLEPIRKLLRETFPGEAIQVQAARDTVSLTGKVTDRSVADRAVALTTPLARSVVNNLNIAGPGVDKQVLLRVRFAELDRQASQSFGVNLISTGALNTIGGISTGQFGTPSIGNVRDTPAGTPPAPNSFSIGDVLNVFAFRRDLDFAAFVRALQTQGLLQILAEPNLVTTNGKEASFLVGGEFPIPVLQGGANAGAVTVQFREFGIRLTFTPQVTENRTVKMYVKPEVSTIDLARAVSVGGFTIPALATRRMETNVELGEGQSFVIAGLVDDRVEETMAKIPGLSNIPLLGVLFKSRQTNRQNSELLVMVTPEITSPLNATDAKPMPPFPREFMTPVPSADQVNPARGRKAARK
ncbi:MAG: pilus assembly protein N-terminal domain-containing protein [Bryobacteraceae bacterium]|nr:pilus assembly protein N-terminal domain-containing protein [Bryobacteraceae bacterium]